MKKVFCLILALLFALPLLAGCNDASFLTDPAGESVSASVGSPSEKESKTPASTPSAPAEEPTPEPERSYPNLPAAVEEIFWNDESLPIPDGECDWHGIVGDGSVDALSSVDAEQYVALSVYFTDDQLGYDEQKSLLEDAELFLYKNSNGRGFFCFVTSQQVAALPDSLKNSIEISVVSQEYFLEMVKLDQ